MANSRGPQTLADLAAGRMLDGVPVVVDTGNHYPQQRDGRIAAIEDGTPESAWVSAVVVRLLARAGAERPAEFRA